MKMKKALLLAALTGLLLCGCGKNTPQTPRTPDSAIQVITQGLTEGRPAVVWEAMPATYQTDVTGLAHAFATKMDAEIYDKAFGMLGKVTDVLKTKRDFFLNSAMAKNAPIDNEKLTTNWNAVVDLFAAVTASELKTLENLKTIDIGKFLQTDGTKIFSQLRTVVSMLPQEGNPIDIFKASIIIDYIDNNNLIERIDRIGEDFITKLGQIENICNVRGGGAFIAFDMQNTQTRDRLIEEMKKKGVIINGCGEKTIRLRPMLIYDSNHMNEFLCRLDNTLKSIS